MGDFGPRLRALREGKGLTQKELALAINSSRKYISQLEGAFRSPGLPTAMKLATALEISLEELLNGPPVALDVPVAALVEDAAQPAA